MHYFYLGLLERLRDGEYVVVAEGYLFEFERRGYLKAGAFVPEVVVEHPDLVKALHEEFAHAGSDVMEAFTVSKNQGFMKNYISPLQILSHILHSCHNVKVAIFRVFGFVF